MSQERVDVSLRFLTGPMAWQADLTRRGPTVRIGANPGPEGLKLEGYRGIDDRHAVITAYNESEVTIAPVGPNQVRVSPHEHVDWNEIHPIRGPVHLAAGCAIHLGPPGRGATMSFLKAERLGIWKGGAVMSEAAQFDTAQSSQVEDIAEKRKIPVWFLPGMAFLVSSFLGILTLAVLVITDREPEPLGPVSEDEVPPPEDIAASYGAVFEVKEVNTKLYDGVDQAFSEFVMTPNLNAAPNLAALGKDPKTWDRKFIDFVARSMQMYLKYWSFWRDLERAKGDYATVVKEIRSEGLPEVLAGIPYQETRYNPAAKDRLLCAGGMWQFQPETAKRYGIVVKGCRFVGTNITDWEPKLLAPPRNAIVNAEYVNNKSCRIAGCSIDERNDVYKSTRGATQMLKETYSDPNLRASGAVVQMTIASHNCGYDDSRYRNGQVSSTNVKPAYERYKTWKKAANGVKMFGDSITCASREDMKTFDVDNINATCNSVLPNVTQTYVPQVVAQHLLAVCYYAKNYEDEPAFAPYRPFVTGSGYCTKLKVPTADEVKNHKVQSK